MVIIWSVKRKIDYLIGSVYQGFTNKSEGLSCFQ
jgi:hypothetical protein